MIYLVSVSKGALASHYAELLVQEIDRFDYRSTFTFYKCHLNPSAELKGEVNTISSRKQLKQKPDAVLRIGTSPNFKGAKALTRDGKCYYFQITENYMDAVKANRKAHRLYSKVFSDLPFFEQGSSVEYPGHFLIDLVRSNRFRESPMDDEEGGTMVSIICSRRSNLHLAQQIAEMGDKEVKWKIIGPEKSDNHLQVCLDAMRLSNVVVVFSDIYELMAAFSSCPAVRLSGGGFFRKPTQSIIRRILRTVDKLVTPRKAKLAVQSVDALISDHQACAELLSAYQKVIDILGANPVFRNLGQSLVEELEAEN